MSMHHKALFVLLKQALKAKGMTYAQLAEGLGISELSVKRLFRDQDCKLSRLLAICDCIGMNIDELFSMQKRLGDSASFLPLEMEQALSNDLQLFLVFILLVSNVSLKEIQALINVDEPAFYLLTRRLEKMGLIELTTGSSFKFVVSLPIRWRFSGPLSSALKKMNMHFIAHCFDKEDEEGNHFITSSRMMSQNSIDELQQGVEHLRQRFHQLSTQDQLFYKAESLQLQKLVVGFGDFPITQIVNASFK